MWVNCQLNPHILKTQRESIKDRWSRSWLPVSQSRTKISQRVNRGVTTYTCINQYCNYISFNPELNRVLGVDKKLQLTSRSSISAQWCRVWEPVASRRVVEVGRRPAHSWLRVLTRVPGAAPRACNSKERLQEGECRHSHCVACRCVHILSSIENFSNNVFLLKRDYTLDFSEL